MPNNDLAVLESARTPQPVTPAAPEAPAEEIPTIFDDLPPEVQQVPVVRLLAIGEPPAVLLEPGQYFPALEPIGRNLPKILQGGLDFYKSTNGEGVLFNPLFIQEPELKRADETGKLREVVPSYAELMGEEPQVIPDDKFESLLKQQEDNEIGLRQLSQQPEAAEVPVEPPPAVTEGKIAQARTKNFAPTTPTSRGVPAGGQILNGLLKRAV